jgi:hypothetical protein
MSIETFFIFPQSVTRSFSFLNRLYLGQIIDRDREVEELVLSMDREVEELVLSMDREVEELVLSGSLLNVAQL